MIRGDEMNEKRRVKVIMGKYIWLAVAPSGFTMPLEEYYLVMQRLTNTEG